MSRRSGSRSSKHSALHRVSWTSYWVFRRYSSEKRKEFVASTGIPATDANAARAYKVGLEKYDAWLGVHLPSGRPLLIKDIARAVLAGKSTKRFNTERATKNQIKNHVIPAFGHLRPDQVTSLTWERYQAEERRKGKRTRLFNTRKALKEILLRAKEEGAIERVPKLKLDDPPPAPPRAIPVKDCRRIRRALPWPVKLVAFVMQYQGARPGEIMQYRWDMIRLDAPSISIPGEITKTGRARTIPLNARVARALRWLRARTGSEWLVPGRSKDRPLSAYNAVWDRAMKSLEFDYTIYNLRDTWITDALRRGLSPVFIGKYCDTSAEMIERKYAVAEDDIMRRVAG